MLHRLRNDFRLSIITLLGASAILGITPFAVLRFLQGNPFAAAIDLTILTGISAGVVYAWRTGDTRRSGLFLALVACSGAVLVGFVVGEPGLFWLYPCLVTTFFLTSPRIAVTLNVLPGLGAGYLYQRRWKAYWITSAGHDLARYGYGFGARRRGCRRNLEPVSWTRRACGVGSRNGGRGWTGSEESSSSKLSSLLPSKPSGKGVMGGMRVRFYT